MDSETGALLYMLLILFGLAAVCLAGVALAVIPVLLCYLAIGVGLGCAQLFAAGNRIGQVFADYLRSSIAATRARRRRTAVVQRSWNASIWRQVRAERQVDALFSQAAAQMERISDR